MKIKEKALNIIETICNFMDKPYFALVLASIELLCYYLGLDLVIILTISLSISFALLFKKNLNCLLVIFLFMSSMISLKNSPASDGIEGTNPAFFFQPAVYITCIVAVFIPTSITFFFFVYNLIKGKVPPKFAFISILTVGVTFLTNGLFAKPGNGLNTLFGSFLLFFFVILFLAIYPRMAINKESIRNISWQVAISSIVVLIEMVVFYIGVLISGEEIYPRFNTIFLGWGNRNTIGLLLTISFCFLLYLVKNEPNKLAKGFSHFLATFTFIAIVLSFSRQSYLAIAALLGIYLLLKIITNTGKERVKGIVYLLICVFGVAVILIVLLAVGYLENITLKDLSDGRISLWDASIDSFVSNPIFGGGFYLTGPDPKIKLDNIVPYLAHDTILQMLGSCGIVGICAYCFYRFETIKEICRNKSKAKIFPIYALGLMIFLSLIDIHILDLMGSAIYVTLLAICMSKNTEDSVSNVLNEERGVKNE